MRGTIRDLEVEMSRLVSENRKLKDEIGLLKKTVVEIIGVQQESIRDRYRQLLPEANERIES